ncbi:MAG: hypothetical protein ACREQQ_08025, partial [Candidatus Binatia bacterium]
YRLVEIERDLGPYLRGAVWAEPSEAALAQQMRRVRQSPEEARRRARVAQEAVSSRFSVPAIAAQIGHRLDGVRLEAEA